MELSFSAIPYQFKNKIQEAKNNMEKYRAVFFPVDQRMMTGKVIIPNLLRVYWQCR